MDHSRDPCPWVALSDFGGAFCMGVSVPYRYAGFRLRHRWDWELTATRLSEELCGMESRVSGSLLDTSSSQAVI